MLSKNSRTYEVVSADVDRESIAFEELICQVEEVFDVNERGREAPW